MQAQNQNLHYLIHPSFQGVNRLLVLSSEDNAVRTGHRILFSEKGKTLKKLWLVKQIVDNWLCTCLSLFQKKKLVAIDLSKQQALDADPKAIQQIKFTGNLDQAATMFFIIQESKETVLDISLGTVRVLWIYFL